MGKIVINGIKATYYNNHDVAVTTEDRLNHYLFTPVEIAEGTTFNDIWQFIIRDLSLYNTIYRKVLGNYDLNIWASKVATPRTPLKTPEDPNNCINFLEVYRVCETSTFFGEKPELTFKTSFHGVGPQTSMGTEVFTGYWSLGFTPIEELREYPITIKNEYNIRHYSDQSGFKKQEPSFITSITWGEFLEAIFDEISFFGNPDQQVQAKNEIIAAAQDAKDHPEKLIPLEDVIRDIENKALGS